MLTQGPAKRVTVYTTEAAKYHHQPVYRAVLNDLSITASAVRRSRGASRASAPAIRCTRRISRC
jgi:hypothetical protein